MNEEMKNIINLIDDDGEEQSFEVIDIVEMDDQEFFILTPELENEPEEDEDVDILILKGVQVEGEDEFELEAIDDEELMEKVFNKFIDSIDMDEDEE